MTSPSPPPSYLLPYATLQPTYADVYADIASNNVAAEKVWLSVYSDNAPQKSIHAKLALRLKEKDDPNALDEVLVELSEGGNALQVQQNHIDAGKGKGKAPNLLVQTKTSPTPASTSPTKLQNGPAIPATTLRVPSNKLPSLLKGRRSERALEQGGGGQISAFDVTTDGYYVAGGEDGEVVLGQLPQNAPSPADESALSIEEKAQRRMQANSAKKRTPLKGHVGDIRSAQFFPSGQVVITAASDMTIRLFSLAGINARTFRGHKRAVTSTRILSRGKRFLSASMDGTLKVWDVAAEKCIKTIAVRRMSGVEALSVVRLPASAQDEVEDGMGEYIVMAGLSSGYTDIFSLRLNVIEPAKPPARDAEDDQPTPAVVSIEEEILDSIPPINWPSTLPEGVTAPGATDFWSLDDTGNVWALDSRVEGDATIRLVAGTKSGVVRLLTLDVNALASVRHAKEKECEDEGSGDTVMSTAESTVTYSEIVNFRRNTSGITNVRLHGPTSNDVTVATQDGTPFRVTFDSENTLAGTRYVPRVKEEYTGWEAGDAVDGIALLQDGGVALAGAEGCVCVYNGGEQ